MEIEKLVQASMDEIQKVLSTISVLGEPKTVEGIVLIPVVSTGLMFGAGGGEGKQPNREQAEGAGGGTGGAGVGVGVGIAADGLVPAIIGINKVWPTQIWLALARRLAC